ncbi:MAG: Ser-Thr-rich GPI-anchored membrane family protein [Candidatus Krumholzibacteriia bacterium]
MIRRNNPFIRPLALIALAILQPATTILAESPAAPPVGTAPEEIAAVTWNFTSSVEGWTGRNGTNVRWSGDGGGRLYVDTYGNDPGIVSPSLSISASSNDLLRMYVWTYCSDRNCTVYFMRSGSSTVYTGGTVVLSNGSAGGTYELDLSGNTDWTGTITQIRIDPSGYCGSPTSPGFIAFDWIQTVDTVPAPIQVVAPNGGEVWPIGSTRTIQWTNPGGYTSFTTQLSLNGGGTWSTLHTGLPGNYYYRDWVVTPPASSNCRIKVTGYYAGGSSSDISDGPFTICQPDLDVTYPNGGQVWWMGHDYTVTWSTSSCTDGTVKIELYRGSTMVRQFESGTPNDGSQVINIPVDGSLVAASDYRIAMSAVDGDPWDFSDGYFTISKPTLTVTGPAGGAVFGPGDTVPITWTSSQVLGNVHIEVYKDGASYQVLTTSGANDGYHPWTVPAGAPTSSCYTVGISAMYGHVYDFSDCFTINGCIPTVTVGFPNGGEVLYLGHDCTVTWNSSDCMTENVKIELYRADDMVLQFEAGTVDDGSQTVNFPVDGSLQAGADYRFAISAADGAPWDFSDAVFSLVKPSLTVLTPGQGGQYDQGTNCPITWQSIAVLGTIQVDLYAGGQFVVQLAAGAANSGSLAWNIPEGIPDGSRYQVALSAMNGHVYDFSDEFTIGDPPMLAFDFPVGYPDGVGYNHTAGWDWLEWTETVWHPGEDWNGDGGGDTDLGDSVHAIADGVVTASADYGSGWGNITVIRHESPEGEVIWSQYAHLQNRLVTTGTVSRGQVIGTIGKGFNNEYSAHLHFEIRKQDLAPDAWPVGWSVAQIEAAYHHPSTYIESHRTGEPVSITVMAPEGGEVWTAGETHEITWIHSGLTGTIQIQPYLGTTPLPNIAGEAPNTGSYLWTIPQDYSESAEYRIGVSALSGSVYDFSENFTIHAANVGVAGEVIPSVPTLFPPVPNPFNPRVTLTFALPSEGRAVLDVYDLGGHRIARLLDDLRGPGLHVVIWDGVDDQGERMASGVYFARFSSGEVERTVKLVLIK